MRYVIKYERGGEKCSVQLEKRRIKDNDASRIRTCALKEEQISNLSL